MGLLKKFHKIARRNQLSELSHDVTGKKDGDSISRGEQQYVEYPWECLKKFLENNDLYPPSIPFLEQSLKTGLTLDAPEVEPEKLAWVVLYEKKVAGGDILILTDLGMENNTGVYENLAFRLTIGEGQIQQINEIRNMPYGNCKPPSDMYKTVIFLDPGDKFRIEVASTSGEQADMAFTTLVKGKIFSKDIC